MGIQKNRHPAHSHILKQREYETVRHSSDVIKACQSSVRRAKELVEQSREAIRRARWLSGRSRKLADQP
jgi:hypothetical protein